MRKLLLFVLVLYVMPLWAQVTVPVIKANFGSDGELRANYFSTAPLANFDDWFKQGDPGSGIHVIDTIGSAAIRSRYAVDAAFRKRTLMVGMQYPQFTSINNSFLLDAWLIRDHHGDDSTVFAQGSNKNGMSPQLWNSPVSQGIPDKNDILDVYTHVRRDGPSGKDSLWLFGGVVIENTTGSRYFDMEMYQTDIYFDRPSLEFKNYGPDAGHTSWTFDANGDIVTTGDIIFTAEFNNTGISVLEARIWINRNDLMVAPNAFEWGGAFDGDGTAAQYGYANILPKSAGNFYTGLQCNLNAWTGSYGLLRQDDSYTTVFEAKQLMEFSVNLSKLGLDPLANGKDVCTMPFRKVLVKSRSSASFTAELKDFVGPFLVLNVPKASAVTDIPFYCGVIGVSTISVTNVIATSVYEWTTADGQILTDPRQPTITVNRPGTYIVTQRLQEECLDVYARDTVVITYDPNCSVLPHVLHQFTGRVQQKAAILTASISGGDQIKSIVLERTSNERGKFEPIAQGVFRQTAGRQSLSWTDSAAFVSVSKLYYRLRITDINGNIRYSKILSLYSDKDVPFVSVECRQSELQSYLWIEAGQSTSVVIELLDMNGRRILTEKRSLAAGETKIPFVRPAQQPQWYAVRVQALGVTYTRKIWL